MPNGIQRPAVSVGPEQPLGQVVQLPAGRLCGGEQAEEPAPAEFQSAGGNEVAQGLLALFAKHGGPVTTTDDPLQQGVKLTRRLMPQPAPDFGQNPFRYRKAIRKRRKAKFELLSNYGSEQQKLFEKNDLRQIIELPGLRFFGDLRIEINQCCFPAAKH
jgi:hypothetical protein